MSTSKPPIAGYYPREIDPHSMANPIVVVTSNWSYLADKMDLPKPLYAVSDVQTPHRDRGQGHARRAMRQLLADADLNHVTLILAAAPEAGYEWVYTWYRRLGFEALEDGRTMVRSPSPMNLISRLGSALRS